MTIEIPTPHMMSRSAIERARGRASVDPTKSTIKPVADMAREIIAAQVGLESLPPARVSYLFVILPLVSGTSNGVEQNFVLYPPEFLFVYDCGFSAHAGLSTQWKTDSIGLGDPEFPNLEQGKALSIGALDYSHLVFADDPGRMIVGLMAGTVLKDVEKELGTFGLSDFEQLFADTYVCKCPVFEERATAQKVSALAYVRYAESDSHARLIDFSPGWVLKRLI